MSCLTILRESKSGMVSADRNAIKELSGILFTTKIITKSGTKPGTFGDQLAVKRKEYFCGYFGRTPERSGLYFGTEKRAENKPLQGE